MRAAWRCRTRRALRFLRVASAGPATAHLGSPDLAAQRISWACPVRAQLRRGFHLPYWGGSWLARPTSTSDDGTTLGHRPPGPCLQPERLGRRRACQDRPGWGGWWAVCPSWGCVGQRAQRGARWCRTLPGGRESAASAALARALGGGPSQRGGLSTQKLPAPPPGALSRRCAPGRVPQPGAHPAPPFPRSPPPPADQAPPGLPSQFSLPSLRAPPPTSPRPCQAQQRRVCAEKHPKAHSWRNSSPLTPTRNQAWNPSCTSEPSKPLS